MTDKRTGSTYGLDAIPIYRVAHRALGSSGSPVGNVYCSDGNFYMPVDIHRADMPRVQRRIQQFMRAHPDRVAMRGTPGHLSLEAHMLLQDKGHDWCEVARAFLSAYNHAVQNGRIHACAFMLPIISPKVGKALEKVHPDAKVFSRAVTFAGAMRLARIFRLQMDVDNEAETRITIMDGLTRKQLGVVETTCRMVKLFKARNLH